VFVTTTQRHRPKARGSGRVLLAIAGLIAAVIVIPFPAKTHPNPVTTPSVTPAGPRAVEFKFDATLTGLAHTEIETEVGGAAQPHPNIITPTWETTRPGTEYQSAEMTITPRETTNRSRVTGVRTICQIFVRILPNGAFEGQAYVPGFSVNEQITCRAHPPYALTG